MEWQAVQRTCGNIWQSSAGGTSGSAASSRPSRASGSDEEAAAAAAKATVGGMAPTRPAKAALGLALSWRTKRYGIELELAEYSSLTYNMRTCVGY